MLPRSGALHAVRRDVRNAAGRLHGATYLTRNIKPVGGRKTCMRHCSFAALLLGAVFLKSTPALTSVGFVDRRDYAAPNATVAVGDLNNDGIPDLVSGDGLNFAVQLGNGDGTFRPGAITSVRALAQCSS